MLVLVVVMMMEMMMRMEIGRAAGEAACRVWAATQCRHE